MSRLELAKQGYEALAPLLSGHQDERVANRAESWLRDEVCPVVSELAQMPKFRQSTLWAVDHLSQDQSQPEWRLISEIENHLVALANVLFSAATEFQEVVSSDDREMLRFIADRPWVEMASPLDFFHPTLSLYLRVTDSNNWHHNRFREREYRDRLGDYVTLCMHGRIEHWQTLLDRIASQVTSSIPPGAADSPSYQVGVRISERQTLLLQAVERLYELCQDETERQWRDASTALVQIYAAYSVRPRLDWIPCGPGELETAGWSIRSVIRRPTNQKQVEILPNGLTRTVRESTLSLCDPAILRQVAAALEVVTPLLEAPDGPGELIEWARQRAPLVLIDGPIRVVYWMGEPVPVEWNENENPWDLLNVMARHPNTTVDKEMCKSPQRTPLKARRSRLSKLLENHQELDSKIVSVRGIGYRLELVRDEVIVLEADGPEDLKVRR